MQKTKYPYAIWDMNVEGAQWGALSANYVEQTLAFTHRVPEQLPNLIAAVYVHFGLYPGLLSARAPPFKTPSVR